MLKKWTQSYCWRELASNKSFGCSFRSRRLLALPCFTTCFLSSILCWPKKLSFLCQHLPFQRWIFFRDIFFPSWRLLTFWQQKTGRFFCWRHACSESGIVFISFYAWTNFCCGAEKPSWKDLMIFHLIDGSMKHETLVGFLPIWIHGTGIVTHMSLIVMVNAGKYTIHEILVRFFNENMGRFQKKS